MKGCCNTQAEPLAVLEQGQPQPHHSILPRSVSPIHVVLADKYRCHVFYCMCMLGKHNFSGDMRCDNFPNMFTCYVRTMFVWYTGTLALFTLCALRDVSTIHLSQSWYTDNFILTHCLVRLTFTGQPHLRD